MERGSLFEHSRTATVRGMFFLIKWWTKSRKGGSLYDQSQHSNIIIIAKYRETGSITQGYIQLGKSHTGPTEMLLRSSFSLRY